MVSYIGLQGSSYPALAGQPLTQPMPSLMPTEVQDQIDLVTRSNIVSGASAAGAQLRAVRDHSCLNTTVEEAAEPFEAHGCSDISECPEHVVGP